MLHLDGCIINSFRYNICPVVARVFHMTCANLKGFLFCLLALPIGVKADVIRPWESEIEFGFQRLTGNADSMALNTRLAINYTQGPYRHMSEARFLLIEKDGEEDKHKSEFESQVNYKFDPKRYVLGNINYVNDKYGPYFKDITFSTGVGYQAIWQEDLSLLLELGPGYRLQIPNLDEIDENDLVLPNDVREYIFRAQGSLEWQINDTAFFEGRITIISGASNTSFESRIALITDLIDKLAVKLSTAQKYISDVPPGLENRDSVFTVTVLYRF